MKAVILSKSGNGVEISDVSKPSPGPQQILVKVKSCGLNRSDLLETQGQSFGHTGGDTKVIGPLLIGLGLPIEIDPLRSSTSEILNLASIAAYSSQVINYKK